MGRTDGQPKNMMHMAIAVVGEEARKQRFQSFLSKATKRGPPTSSFSEDVEGHCEALCGIFRILDNINKSKMQKSNLSSCVWYEFVLASSQQQTQGSSVKKSVMWWRMKEVYKFQGKTKFTDFSYC